jgi:hypothetical protein
MKVFVKFFPVLALVLLMQPVVAQVLDGAFMREHTVERKFIPYQNIREADAMYSKKILRIVELREKHNHPLYFPIVRMTYPAGPGAQPQRSRVNLLYLIYNIGILGETYDLTTGELIDTVRGPRYPVFKLNPTDITEYQLTKMILLEKIYWHILQLSGNRILMEISLTKQFLQNLMIQDQWISSGFGKNGCLINKDL